MRSKMPRTRRRMMISTGKNIPRNAVSEEQQRRPKAQNRRNLELELEYLGIAKRAHL
jgi:hypothetical protein